MLGSFDASILPTSHVMTLVTGSKLYLPWVGVNITLRTAFGNGISTITFSNCTYAIRLTMALYD